MSTHEERPVIVCDNLTKRYGSTLALDALQLTIEAGEPIALIGPNGAGKTTFLSLLCGFIRASKGRVSILGEQPGSAALVGRLAALPQDAMLDPRLSIGHQLRFFAELQGMDRRRARLDTERVLSLIDLRDVASKKPTALSHGMRKRVAIAQALLGSPELVLLDEPTAGIDPPNAKLIRDMVRSEAGQVTFIVSSHNLDELERLCSSVIQLDKGTLVRHGPLAADASDDTLTLRLGDVAPADVEAAVLALPGVNAVRRLAQGDYVLNVDDDVDASIELLQLMKARSWPFRQLGKGRSLEERLYGNT